VTDKKNPAKTAHRTLTIDKKGSRFSMTLTKSL